MDTVSVIIPVYNTDEFIKQCMQSVLDQTYKKLEIIVVNDNSSDDSSKIIEELASIDSRIKVFHFKERKGAGAARNYGMKKASGKYIYFLDSDDYLPEDTINYLVSYIGENDIIRGRMKTTDLGSSFAILFKGTFNPTIYVENKFNLIKNNSATNFLFKKEFIMENNLRFSEKVEIYSDLYFMIPALISVEYVPYLNEAIYFRRQRTDPFINPALSQYDDQLKIKEFINVYNDLKEIYDNALANSFLDEHMVNFYRKEIINYFKEKKNIKEIYPLLIKSINRIKPDMLNNYDWVLKRELTAITKENIKKYIKVILEHNFLRDIKDAIKSKRKFKIFIYNYIFLKLPIKKKQVFFESFAGKGYSDNPKYIYEYLLHEKPEYKFVWSFNESMVVPGKSKQVKRGSLRYLYFLARSKYWVINARMPNDIDKRDETVYLQTWHGTPLKKLAGDLENVFMPGTNPTTYKRNFGNETAKWDYLVSPNSYSSQIFKRAFWFDKELLEFGYPRNDILYNRNNENDLDQLKIRLKIPMDKKVILYAPTWRDDEYFSTGKYRFSIKLNLRKMQESLGEQYIIILRMHYLIASQLDISKYKGFVYDFSTYDDITELYLISDMLVTDYSSVFFDYANLKRPVLFYMYDLEKYRDQLRGFYLDIEKDLPGPIMKNTEQVIETIKNINQVKNEYKERYEEFYRNFCEWDDGNASKNIVKTVFTD